MPAVPGVRGVGRGVYAARPVCCGGSTFGTAVEMQYRCPHRAKPAQLLAACSSPHHWCKREVPPLGDFVLCTRQQTRPSRVSHPAAPADTRASSTSHAPLRHRGPFSRPDTQTFLRSPQLRQEHPAAGGRTSSMAPKKKVAGKKVRRPSMLPNTLAASGWGPCRGPPLAHRGARSSTTTCVCFG